jgi:hypothetical protein
MIGIYSKIPLPPHWCWICHEVGDENTKRDYFIDTGVATYDEGAVYICSICFEQMVRLVPNAMMKSESDELLSYQAEAVGQATVIMDNWKAIKKYAEEHGLDLERFLDGRTIKAGLSNNSLTAGNDQQAIGSDSESHPRLSLKPISF